jgi:hypothetical protein
VLTDHPALGLVDVYAATIPTLKFAPALHVKKGAHWRPFSSVAIATT